MTPIPVDKLLGPVDKLRAAAAKVRGMSGDPVLAELLAQLFEGMAVHWDARGARDWELYEATPLAKLAKHINEGGEA